MVAQHWRFGLYLPVASSLNGHVPFHVCAVDGSVKEVAVGTDAQYSLPGIVLRPASAIDATAVTNEQADLHRRILRAIVGQRVIEKADSKDMLAYQHSGF